MAGFYSAALSTSPALQWPVLSPPCTQDSVLDAITGNAPPTVGQGYGETWLSTAAKAINRIPLPGITDGTQHGVAA
jgi:hypothetical protein